MTRLWLLLLGATLGGCVPRIALVRHPADPVPLARSPLPEGRTDLVWAQAVRLLTARGLGFDACDDERSALRTTATELDAPCRGTTCLARQYVTVKVGGRAVRVSVRREVWDATWRGWVPLVDPRSQADAVRLEQELLGELMARSDRLPGVAPSSEPRCPRPAPCGPGQCDLGLASAQPGGLSGLWATGLAGL